MFDLYKTYNKAKDVFVKPKLKVEFGWWKNMSGLPVWRRGTMISLGKGNNHYKPRGYQQYTYERKGDKRLDGSIVECDYIKTSYHKVPNHYVWRRDIRKKLRKWGLGWIKPVYILPTWLSFYVFDFDVFYKWKYDTVRFEFPPQFTLVIFGWALSFTLVAPTEDDNDCQDFYWESLLTYLYDDNCKGSISKTLKYCGQWNSWKNGDNTKHFQLRKAHIKPEYHDEYDMAVIEYNKEKETETE